VVDLGVLLLWWWFVLLLVFVFMGGLGVFLLVSGL